MRDENDESSQRRAAILAATLLSGLAAAIPPSAMNLGRIEEPWNIVVASQAFFLVGLTCAVALAHALILGLPGYLLLRSKIHVGIVSCGCGGFLIGAVPYGVLTFFSMQALQSASVGGKPTVIDHVPTLEGWIEYATTVGEAGLLGLVGGVTFGIVLRWCGVSSKAGSRDRSTSTRAPAWRSWTIAASAILLTGSIFALSHFVRDTSCHNLFRDGRTFARPQILADLNVTAEDWPTLTQIFVTFGETNSLSFRGDQQIQNGHLTWRSLDLCNEAGLTIDLSDTPWKTDLPVPGTIAPHGMELKIFELTPGADWQSLTGALLDKLESRWPGRLGYRGSQDNTIPRDEAMKGRN